MIYGLSIDILGSELRELTCKTALATLKLADSIEADANKHVEQDEAKRASHSHGSSVQEGFTSLLLGRAEPACITAETMKRTVGALREHANLLNIIAAHFSPSECYRLTLSEFQHHLSVPSNPYIVPEMRESKTGFSTLQ